MKQLRIPGLLFAAALLLSACASPLGQQYGTVGAVGGAAIGGVTGGLPGAVIGGTVGAIGGGLLGDAQSGIFASSPPPMYYPGRRCHLWREPVYDRWGYLVGYRDHCR